MQPKKDLNCLNCGRPLEGEENFCPQCSQKNDIRKVSVKEMVFHFLGGFFAFDNLFFRTLKPLLLKPGLVSKEYIEGKRKKYTNPFIFLLHSAIVFFIVTGLIDKIKINVEDKLIDEELANLSEKIIDSVFANPENIAFIKDTTISIEKKEMFLGQMYKNHERQRKSIQSKKKDTLGFVYSSNKFERRFTYFLDKKFQLFNLHYDIEMKDSLLLEVKNPQEIRYDTLGKIRKYGRYSRVNLEKSTLESFTELKEPHTKWNVFLFERIKNFNVFQEEFGFKESDFAQRLTSSIPMALFIFLPIFALFFSLLYIRHPYTYTEHLIVVFNFQSVLFWLLLIVEVLLAPVNEVIVRDINGLIFIVFLIYVYKTLRYFYKQNIIKTVSKFIIIIISYGLFALIGFLTISGIVILV